MKCPECTRTLADIAETCRCGWQKNSAAERFFVHCAHQSCTVSANTRVKTATGWANFCPTHYSGYFTTQAKDYCLSRGLDTREKQYRTVRQKLAESAIFKNVPAREPGEDSEADVYGEIA